MSSNATRIEKMTALLQAALSPTALEIQDEGQSHLGHAGAKLGKGYFFVSITSEKFGGKSRVVQHQMVYKALGEMLETDIHALRLRTGAHG